MKPSIMLLCLFLLPFKILSAESNSAENAIKIKKVTLKEVSANTFTFFVTLKSPDSGWDYYADGWRVIDSKTGKVYGTRVLAHPHTTEQPFTRSETIKIPSGVNEVSIVAKMNTDSVYPKQGYKKILRP